MPWTEGYDFVEPMLDLRADPARAEALGAELSHEIGPGHVLHGRDWIVVAEAMPQDEVLVQAGEDAYLVHLTWTGHVEEAPWPTAEPIGSADELERLVELRY